MTLAPSIGGRIRDRFAPLAPLASDAEPMTPEARILRIVQMAPATAGDIRALTGMDGQDVFVRLRRLVNAQQLVRSHGLVARKGSGGAQYLYSAVRG